MHGNLQSTVIQSSTKEQRFEGAIMNISDGFRKRRWFHFSLRTLILLVLLIGSAMSLWHNWSAWELKATLSDGAVSFSPDCKLIAIGGTTIEIRSAVTGELVRTLEGELKADGQAGAKPRERLPVFSLSGEWLAGFEEGRNPLDRTAFFWRTSDWSFAHAADGWAYDERAGRLNRVGTIKQSADGPVFGFQDPLPEDLTNNWRGLPREKHPFMDFDPYVRTGLGIILDKRSGATTVLPGDSRDASDYRIFSADGKSFVIYVHGKRLLLWTLRRPMQWWGVACLWEFWLTIAFAGAFIWSVRRTERAEGKVIAPISLTLTTFNRA